ncbi:hypothetical protein J5N97_001062 [Dioscorea zingiberensis]|uniref:Uncharacterized protein n=1 Tax=Dioscorea zingiberensis TaxID=325984 RepID=A0A9D5BUE4_9LILI|nr:hypothetical protein J5N97_001062 [Dioscorea zingiberensis]
MLPLRLILCSWVSPSFPLLRPREQDGICQILNNGFGMNGVPEDGVPQGFGFYLYSEHSAVDRGSSGKYIQVELKSIDTKEMVDFKYLVTLREALLCSELTITNSRSSSLQM